MTPDDVVRHFDKRFTALGTKARAKGAKAYMKSELRFHGVDAAQLRGECRGFCVERPEMTREELVGFATALFATDAFDLRSVAIALLERKRKLLVAADVPWLVDLARAGACWAHVDYLVTQVIGPVLDGNPQLPVYVRAWAGDEDFWVRRVALLAQLAQLRAGAGDFELFAEIAVPMLPEKEFFIRKAIGWVLREVSKKRPALVRELLLPHAAACSGVTWREATKYLPVPAKRELEKARTGDNTHDSSTGRLRGTRRRKSAK
jgi:3-methyladenine DNA glycosylase AlkD